VVLLVVGLGLIIMVLAAAAQVVIGIVMPAKRPEETQVQNPQYLYLKLLL
jgi:hypothetical protein